MANPKNNTLEVGFEKDEKIQVKDIAATLDLSQTKFIRYCTMTIINKIKNPQLEVSMVLKKPQFKFTEVDDEKIKR